MIKKELDKAEKITIDLFEAIEKSNLITAGKSESQLSFEVCKLASEKFGIENHWHKKIVRTGKNTLCIYPDNPPNEIIQEDDIVILDFGPIINGFEADLGRTYVIGNNPNKVKIKRAVENAWYETQNWYNKQTVLKSSDLFQYVVEKAAEYGYIFGGEIAGHIIGKFPHEQPIDPKSLELDIHPKNHNDMFLLDPNGNKRHWILELLFIDRENQIGGYFEQLL
tara:strand:- start:2593 stop:3261 length:669 start_codon:yes stop_codon:yes gene_type:complete